MLDSKTIRQIQAMDGRERERLRQFVASPYFNRHQPTVRLLEFLLKELAKAKPKITEERLATAVAKGDKSLLPTEIDGRRISDLLSGLMKLINKFLAVEQLSAEPFTEDTLTVKRAHATNRADLLDNRGKWLERRLKRAKFTDAANHRAGFLLHEIRGYRNTRHRRKQDPDMLRMLEHLDRYWFFEKLRHTCHLSANAKLMETSYDFPLIEALLDYLASPAGATLREEEAGIDCYYHALLTIREEEDQRHYQHLIYYLGEGFGRISAATRGDAYLFASNYCIIRIGQRDRRYYRELFDLYRRGLATELIYEEDGELSEWNYKNIVTLGTNLRELEWTEIFLERERPRLPAKQRDNAYALNKAAFLYAAGRLDEARDSLIFVDDKDEKYHATYVTLQVKIAYDKAETDYALNLLETFRLFLQRNKNMGGGSRDAYRSFVRLTKQLVNLKHQRDYTAHEVYARKLAALNEKIVANPRTAERAWLLAEVGE